MEVTVCYKFFKNNYEKSQTNSPIKVRVLRFKKLCKPSQISGYNGVFIIAPEESDDMKD